MRDYVRWHDAYDDPDSSLSWRLRRVQGVLAAELDARAGDLRLCAPGATLLWSPGVHGDDHNAGSPSSGDLRWVLCSSRVW